MDISTKLIHLGKSSAKPLQSVNPPIVKTSTVTFPDLEAFIDSKTQMVFENLRYGRYGTQVNFDLQHAMAEIEGTETCIATSSGMSAIVAVLSAYAELGKHILMSEGVYKSTKRFCDQELAKRGIETTYFTKDDSIEKLIRSDTSLIYIEVPASSKLQLLDIRRISEVAHQHGITVASDSTWGTPIFFQPHAFGVDLSIHSATKYINGHSDVILGLITGTRQKMAPVREWCYRHGSHAAPDSCWLTLRGLRTLNVRMKIHQKNTMIVAKWLKAQKEIDQVVYPPFFTGKDATLWNTQFSGGAGPFKAILQPCKRQNFEQFINSLELFSLGASYGGYSSLITPEISNLNNSEDAYTIRLHIGLENPEDLCQDLRTGLNSIDLI